MNMSVYQKSKSQLAQLHDEDDDVFATSII